MASSLAAELCIAQEACCPEARPALSCRHGLNMVFERLDAEASELGLTYNGACVGLQHAIVEATGCSIEPLPELLPFACTVYSGAGGEGAPCTAVANLGSTCGPELACVNGVCTQPCGLDGTRRPSIYGYPCGDDEVADGLGCAPTAELGEPCSEVCDDGLYCPRGGDGCGLDCVKLCRALEPNGGPCEVGRVCVSGVCTGATCIEGASEGAPCAQGCGRGLTCDADRCVPLPYVCTTPL
jgi:hypothetical protein